MSDTTDPTVTPPPAPPPVDPKVHVALQADLEVVRGSYEKIRGERDGLAAQLAAATAERDTFAGKATETAKALEALTNKTRERDVLEGLRAAFPGADATTVRGAFLAAVEDGKASRYPEDPAKAVPAIVELLKQSAPTLSRVAPISGGGPPPPAPPKTGARAGSSFWNIGQRQ